MTAVVQRAVRTQHVSSEKQKRKHHTHTHTRKHHRHTHTKTHTHARTHANSCKRNDKRVCLKEQSKWHGT